MKKLLSVLVLVCSLIIANGQSRKFFRHVGVNQGLAHTDATDVVEDEKGFIWIGTNSGLQRYDGKQLSLFFNTTSKLNQVYNNRIRSLYPHHNHLWIATEGGLVLFDIRLEQFVPIKYIQDNSIVKPDVQKQLVLQDRLFFINHNEAFLGKYDTTKQVLEIFELKKIIDNLPGWFHRATITSIESNKKNELWIGTSKGILSIRVNGDDLQLNEEINFQHSQLDIQSNGVQSILYRNQQLWIMSSSNLQIFSLSTPENKIRSILKTLDVSGIFAAEGVEKRKIIVNEFLVDSNNNFWLATGSGLLYIEEPLSQKRNYVLYQNSTYNKNSISSNNISGIYLDHSNCLWASTWAGGLSYIDLEQKQFSLLSENPLNKEYSLSEAFVRAITRDDDGIVWIAGQNKGIDLFDPKTGICKPFKLGSLNNTSLTSTQIRSLKYYNNKVYVGTTNGLNVIDLKTKKINRYFDVVGSDNPIFCIDIDAFGQVWLATWKNGLYQLKFNEYGITDTVHLSKGEDGNKLLSSNQVNFILADREKNEVLAATKKGLNRIILDGDGNLLDIVYYRGSEKETSLSSEYIWPIVKENDTTYWLGTLGGGLNRLTLLDGWDKNGNGNYVAKAYSVEEGAPSNDIETLLSDNDGRLWIGSKGLSVFNPETEEFWNFDVNDGLQSNGFKIGSSYKSANGILFFGGINGMNYFDPKKIKRNNIKSKVVLTRLKIHSKEIIPGQKIGNRVILKEGITYTDTLRLSYKENDFSLTFASLHYANPQKCRYKYKLDGYEDWHFISGDYPVASYSNLDYGEYTFYVDATNGDGLYSEDPAVLHMIITPPWWLSFWAYVGYLVVSGVIVFIAFNYTIRWVSMRNELRIVEAEEKKKEELHQMKLQFFMNISHEFKTPLTLILTPLEQLKNENVAEEERKRMLQMISVNANRMLTLINELMEFRKAEVGKLKLSFTNGDITHFIQNLYMQFLPLFKKNGITPSFEAEEGIPEIWFDQEKISTIFYNLTSNAINNNKPGGSVKVEIFMSKYENKKLHFKNHFEVANEITDREYIYISVLDSGVGISKQSINQIFDRYFHMNISNAKHLGSGIGLALLKNLVLLHNGHVIVSSERTKGTEFLIGLPIGDTHLTKRDKSFVELDEIQINMEQFDLGKEDLDVKSSGQNDDENTKIMLLVEDNVELREVLKEHFSKQYLVIEAGNGKEALENMEGRQVDFVISDIMMPQMDGIELVEALRDDIKTSHLPIALLTAKSTVEDQIVGTEAGADLYFPKPFNLRLIDLKIKQFLESRKKLSDSFASNIFAESRELVRNKKDKEFIDRFVELVDANIDNNDFTIDQICKELCIGRTNLYKKIRSITGQSMGEFIRGLRLKMAAKILLTEDVSISEVLYRVGINSNSYFTKSFKAQFGMTPTEFINQNGGK